MSDVQRIVVYTPMEDALYNSGMLIPIGGAAVTGLIVFVVLMRIFERKVGYGNRRGAEWLVWGSALAAIAAAALVFHKLAI